MEEYKGFKLKQDNAGNSMFAVIPTYTIFKPDSDDYIAKNVLKKDAKIFIDAYIKANN